MSTEKPTTTTTDVDSKRSERLARLKDLHLRRVCIDEEFQLKKFSFSFI